MAELPTNIGKYHIDSLIAKGGMGSVFKAVHPTLKRSVIIKKLSVRGNPHFIERFKREAEIMMDFKHKNIVNFYDHFKEGSSYYIVLEYVDGFSLDQVIQEQRALPSLLALWIFYQVSKALKYAHDNGVIHRDIKPANILISKTGEVKLVDFGIAAYERPTDSADDGLTSHGMTLGTVSYMPPEQFESTKTVDKSADIYAMGVMLYEMVTAKKPYPGDMSPDNLLMIKKGKYLKVKRLNPHLDALIIRLCGKMIRPKKERRYRDMQEVLDLLQRRFKKEKESELDKQLVAVMNHKNYQAPKKGLVKTLKIALSSLILGLVIVTSGLAFLIHSGRWHEWFYADSHGGLRVELDYAQNDSALKGQPIRAIITPLVGSNNTIDDLDADQSTDLALPSFYYQVLNFFGQNQINKLSSDRTYLPMGWYSLELAIGNTIYREQFYLQPHSIQNYQGRSSGLLLSYKTAQLLPQALELDIKVFDQRINQDISNKAKILIKDESHMWYELEQYPKERLVSGKKYQFRVSANSYYEQELNVDVGTEQNRLSLNVSLQPRPGSLRISSLLEGLELRINGRQTILSGEKSPRLVELELSNDKALFLALSPGPQRLEVQSKSNKAQLDIDLSSDLQRNFTVSLIPGSSNLLIKEIP